MMESLKLMTEEDRNFIKESTVQAGLLGKIQAAVDGLTKTVDFIGVKIEKIEDKLDDKFATKEELRNVRTELKADLSLPTKVIWAVAGTIGAGLVTFIIWFIQGNLDIK